MTPSLDRGVRRAMAVSAAAVAIGAVLLVAGGIVAPQAVAISYLAALTATLAVAVGALLLVMIAHSSGAVWFVPLRRQAEAVVRALPALAVLTLPLVIAPHAFWPWAAPFETLPGPLQEALRPTRAYFHPAFFAMRAVMYWAIWLGTGETLCLLSLRQDAGADGVRIARFRRLSAAGIPLVGLAATWAAFDWMMSLAPDWSSSVYGAYYVAGAMVSALAIVAVLGRSVPLPPAWSPTAEHVQALGRLTLAFVLFWAYLWYSQFFIVWIADVPREAAWYVVRFRGVWTAVAAVVIAGGFAAPSLVLLFRAARGSATVMRIVGIWLLVLHYIDVYWLLVPSVRPAWSWTNLLWDCGALAFVAGSAIACVLWRQAGVPQVALGDPLLDCAVRYEAH